MISGCDRSPTSGGRKKKETLHPHILFLPTNPLCCVPSLFGSFHSCAYWRNKGFIGTPSCSTNWNTALGAPKGLGLKIKKPLTQVLGFSNLATHFMISLFVWTVLLKMDFTQSEQRWGGWQRGRFSSWSGILTRYMVLWGWIRNLEEPELELGTLIRDAPPSQA